jgi:hypothetical protein
MTRVPEQHGDDIKQWEVFSYDGDAVEVLYADVREDAEKVMMEALERGGESLLVHRCDGGPRPLNDRLGTLGPLGTGSVVSTDGARQSAGPSAETLY